eukprot:CAMPEP_0178726588 /NCGR_PEP_ID=MMETSP0699-20121125/27377_1 /TAXON_ID=265572 /ORGANISM="Extubocellulus spinifer, Strain CCMP396" /LENGTH=56 /DNA_ID=CAMNT_0020378179 /DNA_START=8 /DNA_END=175 /DNA_ORIENTATION=-
MTLSSLCQYPPFISPRFGPETVVEAVVEVAVAEVVLVLLLPLPVLPPTSTPLEDDA